MVVVTLTSDFGTGDAYVAEMKAAILSLTLDVQLVDVTHDIAAHDVTAGALALEAAVPWFPPGSIHVGVVDPGVGTGRRGLVLAAGHQRFVGPDNGLFTPFLVGAWQIRQLTAPDVVPRPASATFHGRDLFAPVAGWLAAGGDAALLGPEVHDPVRLDWPSAERKGDEVHGRTLTADPYGNVVTSIRELDVRGRVTSVWVGDRQARWVRTFGDGERGELLALLGSGGRVEVAVREGNAAMMLGGAAGLPVRVRLG